MGLIIRGDKKYLIRTVRIGDRVTSRLVAKGEAAVKLHRAYRILTRPPDPFDRWQARQEVRDKERAKLKARRKRERRRQRAADLEASVKALADEVKTIGTELMQAAGYHQHKYTWRKRRGGTMATEVVSETERKAAEDKARAEIAYAQSPQGIKECVEKWVNYDKTRPPGAPSVVEATCNFFQSNPAKKVAEKLICSYIDIDLSRELLRQQMAAMQRELEGPAPTMIERLLAERIAICWLDTYVSDLNAMHFETKINLFSTAEMEHYQKNRHRAHNRYIGCLKTLALIRAKALPALRLTLGIQDGASGSAAMAQVETAGRASLDIPASPSAIDQAIDVPGERLT